MQLEFYNALKTKIETLTSLKYVALWNNQFVRENENVSFDYPNCFIEFTNITFTELLGGMQQYTMDINLHIGFESYKTEDTQILQLKQDLQAIVHYFQQGYNTKMLRRSENQNFDHDNVQEYIISYAVSGKDFSINNLPSTDATVTTLIVNNTLSTSIGDTTGITTEIGYVLATESGYPLIKE
jgi:hypothetical protein